MNRRGFLKGLLAAPLAGAGAALGLGRAAGAVTLRTRVSWGPPSRLPPALGRPCYGEIVPRGGGRWGRDPGPFADIRLYQKAWTEAWGLTPDDLAGSRWGPL